MAERSGNLGRVRVRGEEVDVQLEPGAVFEIERGDVFLLTLLYDFVDLPHEKEHMHVHLDVSIDGMPQGSADASVRDVPMVDDSRRGALSVRVRAPSRETTGTFNVSVRQELGDWNDKTAAPFRVARQATGSFRIRVR